MSRLRQSSLLALAAVLAFWMLLFQAPLEAHADPGSQSSDSVSLTDIAPAVLTNEEKVTFTVHLASLPNGVDTRISAFMTADSLPDSEAIDSFLDRGGNVWSVGDLALTDEQFAQAKTAAGVDVTLEFEVSALPIWNPEDWGPVGVEIRAVQGEVGSRQAVDSTRGLLLWYADQAKGRAQLNALVSDAWQLRQEEWPTLGREGVTLALKPDQARSLSSSGSGEVLVLPTQAADVSLLAATQQTALLDLATRSRSAIETPSGAKWVQDALLTSDEWLSRAVLEVADGATVLSPPDGLPGATGATGSAKYAVSPETGEETAGSGNPKILVSYPELSKTFSDPSIDSLPEFHRDQLLRAYSAVATKSQLAQKPNSDARLWVNLQLGRGSEDAGLSVDQARERLGALFDAPWIKPVTLAATLKASDFGESSGRVPAAPLGDVSSTAAALEPVEQQTVRALAVIGGADAEPGDVISLAQRALPPAALGLTADQILAQAQTAASAVQERYDIIGIVPSQSVNITGPKASFPVTVTNGGEAPIDVQVGLVPSNQLIQVDEWVPVTIPANSTENVSVPVRAVGSGHVNVVIEAKAADGTVLATAPEVLVRSHPALGDAITWVVGSILGVLFLFGLVRTIRKGRRRSQPAEG